MKNSAHKPYSTPFYDSVADLNLEELKLLGKRAIKEFKEATKKLEKSTKKDTELLREIQDINIKLHIDAGALFVIDMFHPKKDFRDYSSEFIVELSSEMNKFSMNANIYKLYKNNISPIKLDAESLYLYKLTLDDYKRSGVDKPKEIRDKINKLMDQMSELSNKFSRNINENTPSIKLKTEDLEGCFDEFIESNKNKQGQVEIVLVTGNVLHILHNCKIKSTREKVRELSLNSSKDNNWKILPTYLNKAEQLAKLVGFNNFAELSMQDKMIENPNSANRFIDDLLSSTKDRVNKELNLIKKYKEEVNDSTELSYADIDYYGNQIATRLSELDEESLKEYFPYKHVKESILRIFEEMFTITFEAEKFAKVWNKDVEPYRVMRDDKIIGMIYLDMHPRKGKYNHACSVDIIPGINKLTLPQNILLCNFNKPSKNGSGLQSLEEVSTFFHEFGHLLHGILGGQEVGWLELSGTNVQRDFVEAPSQLLEEIIMDPQVLKMLTKHVKTNEQIPDEFIKAIKDKESIFDKAKLKGIGIARQASLSEQSLKAYTIKNIDNSKLTELEQTSSKNAMHTYGDYYSIYNFGHLTGYASDYYTYMWSLAISKDLFTKFNKKNLLDKKVAEHYRKTILEPGGSKPAAELVKDFLGREWNMDAFKEYLKEGEELLSKI